MASLALGVAFFAVVGGGRSAILGEMIGDFSLLGILILLGVLLISMSIHEAMHAFVGYKLGDDTAHDEGRISLNPLRHIDPFMTVLLPAITLILFQAPILAAKPVPFNPERVKFEEFGAAMIAAAGPLSNLLLAVLAVVFTRATGIFPEVGGGILGYVIYIFISLNVALFVFNLLPIPPLDGSRVLYAFSPEPLQRLLDQLEPYGLFLVFGLVLFGGLGYFIANINQGVLNFLL